VVPVSDLPSEGFSPGEYEYNIWPELGAPNPGNMEISDFAPNNSDALVSVAAPEPATMSLVGATAPLLLVYSAAANAPTPSLPEDPQAFNER